MTFPRVLRSAVVLALAASAALAQTPPLKIVLKNNTARADDQVYLGFIGDPSLAATNVATGAAIKPNTSASPTWYTLNQLTQGINLTSFSGRIYVGYGSPWTFANPGYEPSPTNPSDPNYFKPYDKMELTYHGNAADVADTTSIDYFSIPMQVKVYKGGLGGTLKGAIKSSTTPATLQQVQLATRSPGAAVVRDTSGSFVRVIGPGVYPPTGGLPASPYDDFGRYLTYLKTDYAPAHGNTVARIKGHFGGVGPAPTTAQTKGQNYDFAVSINANRDLVLTGTGGVVGGHTITFKYADLTSPTGIYGANPSYYLDGTLTNPANDLYGWMAGDLLAGLNIGAVGSPVVRNGVEVGTMDSSKWFTLTDLFAGLQPNGDFYNTWAASLSQISDAYNFAYSDRFAPVTATLDPSAVDTLLLEIGGPSVPDPSGVAAPAAGAVLVLLRRRSSGRKFSFRRTRELSFAVAPSVTAGLSRPGTPDSPPAKRRQALWSPTDACPITRSAAAVKRICPAGDRIAHPVGTFGSSVQGRKWQ